MADACEYCIKRKWPYLRNFTPDADLSGLINLTLVPNISARELRQHWFMKWLVACSAPSHYLNQCCLIVNWTLRNKPQCNSNGNTKLFIHKNAFGNVVCESGGHFVYWEMSNYIPQYSLLCPIYQLLAPKSSVVHDTDWWMSLRKDWFKNSKCPRFELFFSKLTNIKRTFIAGNLSVFACYSAISMRPCVTTYQESVRPTVCRSNAKFDQNSNCSSLKQDHPITTTFCTRHDRVTIVTCTKCHSDRPNIHYAQEHWKLSLNFKYDQNIVGRTDATAII